MDLNSFFSEPALVWFVIGLIFVLLEFTMPGFVIIFFGAGAWVTSLVCLVFDINLTLQLLIFLIVSVASLLILRRNLKAKFFSADEKIGTTLEDEFIGKIGTVKVAIKPGREGRISFKGADWTATAETEIKVGEKVRIVDKESICLKVEHVA